MSLSLSLWLSSVSPHVVLVAESVGNQLIVCRVYASIADMLGYMARESGIRAGPAANVAWKSAFSLLEVGVVGRAVRVTIELCDGMIVGVASLVV